MKTKELLTKLEANGCRIVADGSGEIVTPNPEKTAIKEAFGRKITEHENVSCRPSKEATRLATRENVAVLNRNQYSR